MMLFRNFVFLFLVCIVVFVGCLGSLDNFVRFVDEVIGEVD